MSPLRRVLGWGAAALLFLMAWPAQAGGCPMCRTAGNALGEEGQRSLNYGILLLLLPILGIFAIFLVVGRRLHRAETEFKLVSTEPLTPSDKPQ